MQTQLKEQKSIPLTRDDFIIMQLREIREDIRDLRGDIKDVRNEIKDVRKELNGRMDKLENEVRATSRHSQIMAGSVIAIALGVLYFVFTH
ncbi:MAG: hypothetical protein IJG32_09065 [Selenomonadaceae bacterium]|nr:hypothetical protein [Selenomonadaceae bacterium]MBQ4404905.1 hypothetical protein [Selenomonadaceae bacterium]